MNCQSFENIIDDLAREQLIEASLRKEALLHSDECSTCAERLAEERSLTQTLRALTLEMNTVSAPSHVESIVLAAFNEHQLSQQSQRPRRWNYQSAAAAAVLLVGLGIGVAAWNLRPPRHPQVVTGNTSTASDNATRVSNNTDGKPLAITVKPETSTSAVRRRPLRRPTARVTPVETENVSTLAETEVASDFMPIGYLNSGSLQDGGSVVRVELPRSTIVSLGFAVNMDRYGERVKADVLMGADGLARAIRFVQ